MTPPANSPIFPTVEELAAQMPQFEILEQLSAGQESAIYHARQPILDREVMIRVLVEPDAPTAAKFMQRLQNRARLSHPKVVSVYDFGRTMGGQLYLSSEHVKGRVLREMIQTREVPPKLAFSLAMQCCELMQELHQEGQLHGALDARCVLVQPDGHIKWTGVGMSLTSNGEASWLHGKEPSKTDDLRALGSLLHELFSREALDRESRISRDIPPSFAAVIRRCISEDDSKRFASAIEARDALIAALEMQRSKAEKSAGGSISDAAQTPSTTTDGTEQASAPASEVTATDLPVPEPRFRRGHGLIHRINHFLWGLLKFGLHAVIFLITAIILTVSYLLKDKIIIREKGLPNASVSASAPAPKTQPMPAAALSATQSPAPTPAPKKPSAPSREELLEGLRTRYLNRLKDATQRALDQVRLDDLPFYRNELDLINAGGEVPETHEANAPQALRELREEYHQQRKRLIQRSNPQKS